MSTLIHTPQGELKEEFEKVYVVTVVNMDDDFTYIEQVCREKEEAKRYADLALDEIAEEWYENEPDIYASVEHAKARVREVWTFRIEERPLR